MDEFGSLLFVAAGLFAVYRWRRSLRGTLEAVNRNNEHFLIRTAMKEGIDPGRREKVLRQLTRRIERRPREELAYLQRAVIHHVSGRLSEAIEDYSQVLLLRPAHIYALLNRASLWEASGEAESAIADLDQLLEADQSHGGALLLRGRLLCRQGRRDEAIADLERSRRTAVWDRDDRINRIWLRIELRHDFDAAESEIAQEIEADPHSLAVRHVRGCLRASAGHTGSAREDFEFIASQTGEGREERCYRSYALMGIRRWKDATEEFARYLEIAPDDHQARQQRAWGLLYLGEIDRSLLEWNELVRRAPGDPEPLVYRAKLHADAGRYHEAVEDLRMALRHSPTSTLGLNDLAWLLATCPSARFRNGPEAVRLATQACDQTEWDDENYLGTLAAAYAECGQFAEAIRWEEQSEARMSATILARWGFLLERYRAGQPYRSSPGESHRELQRQLAEAAGTGADG